MCVTCVIEKEEVQRLWLSVKFPIPKSSVTKKDKHTISNDSAMKSSICDCRGLRVMTLLGIPNHKLRPGSRGTVIFEEEEGVFAIRWDNGRVTIHERNFFYAAITTLGYSEFETQKPKPTKKGN